MEGRNFIAIEDQPKGSQGAINFVESIDNACRSIATVMTKGPDPIKPINPETRCAVNRVLRLTMELFSSVSKKPIGANFRAYCHLYYHSGHKLLPLTSVGESTFDRDAEIPCDVGTTTTWWIISRAFHKREWECADVDWANMPKDASASLVSKELNAVFAFPIRLASQDSKVLGTIDINSNKTTKDLGWPKPSKLEEFGREGAAAVYHILNHNLPTP
jgi:hypothetical protein